MAVSPSAAPDQTDDHNPRPPVTIQQQAHRPCHGRAHGGADHRAFGERLGPARDPARSTRPGEESGLRVGQPKAGAASHHGASVNAPTMAVAPRTDRPR